jgi:16S rRNA (cytidine1402-2'-O)-methyltransferase
VLRTLEDLRVACGDDRVVVVTRELTKLHEEVVRGPLGELDIGAPRGEYVLVIDGAPVDDEVASDDDVRAALRAELGAGASTRDASATVARMFGRPKREVYALAIALDRQTGPHE